MAGFQSLSLARMSLTQSLKRQVSAVLAACNAQTKTKREAKTKMHTRRMKARRVKLIEFQMEMARVNFRTITVPKRQHDSRFLRPKTRTKETIRSKRFKMVQ